MARVKLTRNPADRPHAMKVAKKRVTKIATTKKRPTQKKSPMPTKAKSVKPKTAL